MVDARYDKREIRGLGSQQGSLVHLARHTSLAIALCATRIHTISTSGALSFLDNWETRTTTHAYTGKSLPDSPSSQPCLLTVLFFSLFFPCTLRLDQHSPTALPDVHCVSLPHATQIKIKRLQFLLPCYLWIRTLCRVLGLFVVLQLSWWRYSLSHGCL